MRSKVLPLTRQCSSKEQRLLRALRAMNGRNAWPSHAGHLLEELGVDSSGIYSLARLMRAIEDELEEFELLGPGSQFVSRDELNLLAALGQPLELEEAARTRARIIGNEEFHGAELIRACAEALERANVALRPRAPLKVALNPLDDSANLRVRPQSQRRLRPVRVESIEEVTTRVRRLQLTGEAFDDFTPGLPAQWVLLFLGAGEQRNRGRIYVVREFDAAAKRLTLDVVLNPDGETSHWIRHARPGDQALIAGPRGGFALHEEEPWLLLAGDESALPAIVSIITAQPPARRITALLEVENRGEIQPLPTHPNLDVQWLVSGESPTLAEAIQACASDHPHGYAWVGAEASDAREIRLQLTRKRGFGFERTYVTGFWKRGEPRYKDLAAG